LIVQGQGGSDKLRYGLSSTGFDAVERSPPPYLRTVWGQSSRYCFLISYPIQEDLSMSCITPIPTFLPPNILIHGLEGKQVWPTRYSSHSSTGL